MVVAPTKTCGVVEPKRRLDVPIEEMDIDKAMLNLTYNLRLNASALKWSDLNAI